VADYITAATSEQVKEGEILAVIVDETPIGLTRLNGRVCAFHDICTHDDGPLAEGALDGGAVVCPRHGARFNLLTGAPTFPAPTGISIYETVEENGEVKVRL
jgi:3-phenylpropionate/trans-cinnamate dioxygenase ferredoxin subunit